MTGPPALDVEGRPCPLSGERLPSGLERVDDVALLDTVRLPAGKGGLCSGATYVARKPVRVWRLWDGSRPWTAYGGWWALGAPLPPRERYREAHAICPDWSALDRLIVCELKPGAVVAIGPTQSADCGAARLPPTAHTQVYVQNQAASERVDMAQCLDGGTWPAAPAPDAAL